MITKAKIKTWGSSLGIVIPSQVVKEEQLKPGAEVLVDIKKKPTLREVFGIAKDWKIDPQKLKDQLRKEWSKW